MQVWLIFMIILMKIATNVFGFNTIHMQDTKKNVKHACPQTLTRLGSLRAKDATQEDTRTSLLIATIARPVFILINKMINFVNVALEVILPITYLLLVTESLDTTFVYHAQEVLLVFQQQLKILQKGAIIVQLVCIRH